MQLRLEKCTPKDLKLLVKISKKTFADAFEAANNPEDFKVYVDYAFADDKIAAELSENNTSFYFVYGDFAVVGYFKLNENDAQTELKSEKSIELERIYVIQDFQGQRIGQWVLDEVKKIAAGKQKEFLWLGVWEKNPQAIKFYQKHGFSKFGTHPYYIGKDKQTDWLMRFELKKPLN